jgi:ankyrin repeat protein
MLRYRDHYLLYNGPSRGPENPCYWLLSVVRDALRYTRRYRKDRALVHFLLEHGAHVYTYTYDEETLRSVYRNGLYGVAQILLRHGADVHANEDWALRLASEDGHFELVQMLLQHGADVHACNDWPLRWACYTGCLEIVQLLLENGADVHANNDQPLHFASGQLASGGRYSQVVELLRTHS